MKKKTRTKRIAIALFKRLKWKPKQDKWIRIDTPSKPTEGFDKLNKKDNTKPAPDTGPKWIKVKLHDLAARRIYGKRA